MRNASDLPSLELTGIYPFHTFLHSTAFWSEKLNNFLNCSSEAAQGNSQLIEDASSASETEQSAPCASNRTPRRRSSPGNTSSQYFVQLTSGKRSGAWVLLSSSKILNSGSLYKDQQPNETL